MCVFVYVWVTMPIFPTLVLWAKRIAKTKHAHIWALTCQGLLVPLNVRPIICLSLSALYSLSCPCSMASSHCPSHPAHTHTYTLPPRSLSFNTYKTEKIRSGLGSGHLEAAKEFGISPVASCSIVLSAAVSVNSRHWRLLPSLFTAHPLRQPSWAPLGRLSQAVSCLMLFCKLLSPGSLLITVQGLWKPTQRRLGEGQRTGTLAVLKRLRRWSIQIPNEIITTN